MRVVASPIRKQQIKDVIKATAFFCFLLFLLFHKETTRLNGRLETLSVAQVWTDLVGAVRLGSDRTRILRMPRLNEVTESNGGHFSCFPFQRGHKESHYFLLLLTLVQGTLVQGTLVQGTLVYGTLVQGMCWFRERVGSGNVLVQGTC